MVLVTVVELVTVVVIVVKRSTVDVGFMHMGAAVVLVGKLLSCESGQPIGVQYALFTAERYHCYLLTDISQFDVNQTLSCCIHRQVALSTTEVLKAYLSCHLIFWHCSHVTS